MELKDFLGMEVIEVNTGDLMTINQIHACFIELKYVKHQEYRYDTYCYDTGTCYDNVFTRGYYKFVNPEMQVLFVDLYEKFLHSKEGREEAYFYNYYRYD